MKQRRVAPVCCCILLAAASGCVTGLSKASLHEGTSVVLPSAPSKQPKTEGSADQASGLVQAAFHEMKPVQLPALGQPQEMPQATKDKKVDKDGPPKTDDTLPQPQPLPPDPVPGMTGSPVAQHTLVLEDVIASVETNFPLLLAAVQEQGITSGQLLTAQGAFDLNLRAREFWQVGTFESHRINVGVDQNTAWNGLSYYAGYRQSVGDFPIYYGDRKTGDGGEF